MLKILKIGMVVVGIMSLVLFYSSCGKRDNPAGLTILNGLDYTSSFNDTASFWFNYMGNNTYREVSVYTPPGYDSDDSLTLYPVLYLLHGFGGNQNYFTDLYGLNHIADEMIAAGEIVPMVIATIDASSELGGGWYTDTDSFGVVAVIDTIDWTYTAFNDSTGDPIDSAAVTDTSDVTRYFAGLFEQQIVTELRNKVESEFHVYTTRRYMGIGGHSMGGYGAIKIAMRNSDVYSSVSSMSGLLAFRGDDFTYFGIINFIPLVLAENGLSTNNSDSLNQALFFRMRPSYQKTLTSMMMSMASIFSPHRFGDADTTHWIRLTTAAPIGIDLPFDYTYIDSTFTLAQVPSLIDTTWNRWLENDVLTMLADTTVIDYADELAALAIYLDCGDSDELGLKYQNDIFDAALTQAGIEHEYHVYSGYTGNSAGHANFVAERLREVLKFHSRQFSQ
jgi:S-formylglutathione hydrolase FrmB